MTDSTFAFENFGYIDQDTYVRDRAHRVRPPLYTELEYIARLQADHPFTMTQTAFGIVKVTNPDEKRFASDYAVRINTISKKTRRLSDILSHIPALGIRPCYAVELAVEDMPDLQTPTAIRTDGILLGGWLNMWQELGYLHRITGEQTPRHLSYDSSEPPLITT